jgi:hypothetical protein
MIVASESEAHESFNCRSPPKNSVRHDSCSGAPATPPDSRNPFPPFLLAKTHVNQLPVRSLSRCDSLNVAEQTKPTVVVLYTMTFPQSFPSPNPWVSAETLASGIERKCPDLCPLESRQQDPSSRRSFPLISLAADLCQNTGDRSRLAATFPSFQVM